MAHITSDISPELFKGTVEVLNVAVVAEEAAAGAPSFVEKPKASVYKVSLART